MLPHQRLVEAAERTNRPFAVGDADDSPVSNLVRNPGASLTGVSGDQRLTGRRVREVVRTSAGATDANSIAFF